VLLPQVAQESLHTKGLNEEVGHTITLEPDPERKAPVLLLKPKVMVLAQAQPAPTAPPQAQESPYTKWLNEDVAYIISEQERVAFRALQTDQERKQFIQQFWLRRDPTPGTPENEFMIEHYRRIRYANEHFGTLSGLTGWKTDRGRIYITFGPPDERDEHPATATNPASDLWRYTYLEGIGYNVNIEFDDVAGTGEYHMSRDPNPPPNRGRGGAQ
jgi:GWxTD domain-containing protein